MASSGVSRLLEVGSLSTPTDFEMRRLFHPTKMRVERLSLRRLTPSILRQQDTWDYLQLSDQAFAYLMRTYRIFPPLWDLVRGFGIKFEPKDENIVSLKSSLSSDSRTSVTDGRSEVCYNIRYFEKHNRRGTKAIWSERQVALYHTFDMSKQSSLWILIQPSESIESQLQNVVHDMQSQDLVPSEHFDLHAMFALVLAATWRSYINYLEDQLSELDEKALNSSVVNACKLDYPVTFRDAQDLELVRRKLLKASLILRSSVDVGRSLRTHIEEVARTLQQSKSQRSLEVLDQYAASLEMHARIVDALLERLSGTTKLIFHMLEYRREEIGLTTGEAIRNDGHHIKRLTEQTAAASDLVADLTKEMRNDSKFIKMITFLALLYAPASLAATTFSSNLVQVIRTSGDRHMYMVLVSDFWKYPLLAIVMAIITVAIALCWNKYWPTYGQRLLQWIV